jgi:plastocyanin
MDRRHMPRRTAALIAALSCCAACGSNEPTPAAAAPPAAAITTSEVTGVVPRNAIVTLLPAEPVPMPAGPAVMDQYSKSFVPNVLYVRVGQPVEFRNSEDMPHNVTVIRRGSGTEVFNVGTEPHQKYVHTFDRVSQFDVICDIHPGMQATLIATQSPLATIAGDDGRFSLSNVNVGTYKLSLTFEGRTVEQPLEVSQARTEVRVTP